MNYCHLLADALQSGATRAGYNMDAARKYLKTYAPDRRYQLYAVCGTASWAWNENGKIRYAGRDYEYQQTETGYIVKPATW